MRRLPHQGARHSTIDHGDASDGIFLLLHLWVLPSSRTILLANDLPLLFSLACGRPLERMDLSLRMAVPPRLRVEVSSRARRRGAEPTSGVGQAGRTGPTGPGPSRPGSVAPSLPWVLMYLCPLPPPLAPFLWCHPCTQDGGSPCMKSGLLRFNHWGCSFVTLQSSPPLGVVSSSS
jgi:hypothetical protein